MEPKKYGFYRQLVFFLRVFPIEMSNKKLKILVLMDSWLIYRGGYITGFTVINTTRSANQKYPLISADVKSKVKGIHLLSYLMMSVESSKFQVQLGVI